MKKVIKISTKICGALLAILGFSAVVNSCSTAEYGTPSADFFLDGNIVSEETNEPIKNLKVRWSEKSHQDNKYPIDSVHTNESGGFSFYRLGQFPMREYSLDIQDIDGNDNGAFNDTTINVSVNNNEYYGGSGNWYSGKYHKSFDIKLTPKN